jgi:periplasmic protein TonB
MKSIAKRLACRFVVILFAGLGAFEGSAQAESSGAYIDPHEAGGYAIDAKGIRHNEVSVDRLYGDCSKMIAPDYPHSERAQRHTGKGFFRLELDLKSGAVIQATVARSTGFEALDNSAIAALRKWRWKPNRWREVEIPVTFTLERSPH